MQPSAFRMFENNIVLNWRDRSTSVHISQKFPKRNKGNYKNYDDQSLWALRGNESQSREWSVTHPDWSRSLLSGNVQS